jgi:uncharacterized protein
MINSFSIFNKKKERPMKNIINYDGLRQYILDQFYEPRFSIHGAEHWRRVERNGLLLATRSGADVDVIKLFAVFHDSRRQCPSWSR